MTLTKRLYRIDEVRAAFLYTLRSRRVEESQFWLRELEDSLYGSEAQRLLFVAWTIFVGLSNLTWLLEWCRNGDTREGRQKLCYQFVRLVERDSSLWWILVATPLVESDSQVIQVWRHKCVLDGEEFWQSVVDSSTDGRIDEILEGLQADLKGYVLFAKVAAVAMTTVKLGKSCWGELSQRSLAEFMSNDTQDNVRLARKYEIPYDCLFGMCWRGRGADTTSDLMTFGLRDIKGSAYWRKVAAEHIGEDSMWASDEALETFWDTHFDWVACDHPDEWSAADRRKSHGQGVNCQIGAPLWRWWRGWIPKQHLWFWGYQKSVCWKWVEQERADVGDTVLSRVLELYKGLEPRVLEPRKKKVFRLEESV